MGRSESNRKYHYGWRRTVRDCATCQHYALLKKPEVNDHYSVYGHCLKKPGSFYPVYIPNGGCKAWKAEPDKYVGYHITPYKNLQSITENGLIPQIGERSKIAGETTSGVFLFRTLSDAYDAFLACKRSV